MILAHPPMSAGRRTIVSLFICWHLAAMAVAAIPSPEQLAGVAGTARAADDSVSAIVRPFAGSLARVLLAADRLAAAIVAPVRPVFAAYVTPLGLEQAWNMFANPPLMSEYLRVRYYVREPEGRTALETEIVFPVRPSGLHVAAAFRRGHQDKAVSNAVYAYLRERNRRRLRGESGPIDNDDPAASRTLAPVVAYFRDRFVDERYRTTGVRPDVVRSEAWYGVAASRAPGEDNPFALSHAAALSRYPAHAVAGSTAVPALERSEREADITWFLLFATPQ